MFFFPFVNFCFYLYFLQEIFGRLNFHFWNPKSGKSMQVIICLRENDNLAKLPSLIWLYHSNVYLLYINCFCWLLISLVLLSFQTLSVEFIHDHEGKEAIQTYMLSKGYYVHSEVTHYNWLANDFIFVKN